MAFLTQIYGRPVSLVFYAVFFITGLLLAPLYQYHLNPDGVQYIQIARHYLEGDFQHAVNGYWSPLFSWALVPFLAVGIDAFYAAKLVLLLTGLLTLLGLSLLEKNLSTANSVSPRLYFISAPFVLYAAFKYITPDLLVTCMLVFVVCWISHRKYLDRTIYPLLCGLYGGLAYLSKAFAFPFFIAFFTICHLYFFLQFRNKKRVLETYIAGLLVFFLISGTWILVLQHKYQKWSIGSAGAYNFHLTGPDTYENPVVRGLLEPPHADAVSVMEDPFYIRIKEWSPLETQKNLYHQVARSAHNTYRVIKLFMGLWTRYSIIPPLFLLFFVVVFAKYRQEVHARALFILLAAVFVYSFGYIIIFIVERFFWFPFMLLMLLLAVIFIQRVKDGKFSFVLIILCAVYFTTQPLRNLIVDAHAGYHNKLLADKMQEMGIHGKIASDRQYISSFFICFYTESQYYGQIKNYPDVRGVQNALSSHDIDYFLIWGHPLRYPFLDRYPVIFESKADHLTVYCLTQKQNYSDKKSGD